VAIGVFSILVAGAFGLASGAIQLTREVSDFEKRELARMRFLQLCRSTFRELPNTAGFRLIPLEWPARYGKAPGGAGHLQVLQISGHPRAFHLGSELTGMQGPGGSVLLSSRPDGGGGWMIQLHYLDVEETLRFSEQASFEVLESSPLILMRGIRRIEWRFYDAEREEWANVWEDAEKRPRFTELHLRLPTDRQPSRSVFWLPNGQLPPRFASLEHLRSNPGERGELEGLNLNREGISTP